MFYEALPLPEALPQFSYLTPEAIAATAKARLAEADRLVAEIVASGVDHETELTFDDTVVALDRIEDVLGWEGERGREEMLMAVVHPFKEIREASGAAQGRLQAKNVYSDEELYRTVKTFSESDAANRLEPKERRALESTLRKFRLAGQELTSAQKEQLRELQLRLDAANREYFANIAEDTPKLMLTMSEKDVLNDSVPGELDGLPPSFHSQLVPGEDTLDGKETRVVDLKEPQVNAILKYATNRGLRERAYKAFWSVAKAKNRPLLKEMATLRLGIANLLGYESWAAMQLEDQMAENVAAVESFYDGLIGPLQVKVAAEIAEMQPLLTADGHDGPIQAWDIEYYATKIQEKLGVNEKLISEYLPVDAVREGIFALTGEMLGVAYEKIENADVWHEDVTAWRILNAETGEEIGSFYLDLFPRDGKRSSGATYTLRLGNEISPGVYQTPVSAVVTNLTPPGKDGTPSLLSLNDTKTFLHEMAHVLHISLARTKLVQQGGDHTEQDFREAVSQMLDQWAVIPRVIQRLSRHYLSGLPVEPGQSANPPIPIPPELVEALPNVQHVSNGMNMMRHLRVGRFDLSIHDATNPKDFTATYNKATALLGTPIPEGVDWTTRIPHYAIPDYTGRYHSYAWSLVSAAEILGEFLAPGADFAEVGARYRRMLTHGGELPARQILEDFLGRPSDQTAFLHSLGLTA